jgi:hypothetical protein
MRNTSLLHSAWLLVLVSFSAALPAHAGQHCEFSASRDSELDLSGIKTVVFDIGPHQLNLTGHKGPTASIRGKACASDAKRLAELTVSQRREGDKLIVLAGRNGLLRKGSWSGRDYSRLSLNAAIPEQMAVRVRVGSGDATIAGIASASADVGSGRLDAQDVRGTFYADVGSGEVNANGIGALHAVTVGSGGLSVRNVRGDARVGEINSGEFSIANAKGSTRIGSIGSGGASVTAAGGDVTVESIGSGGIEVEGADGDLIVDSVGSGSVRHRGIRGKIRIPKDD